MANIVDIAKVCAQAESYYRNGEFYCSEAVVKSVRDAFEFPWPDEIIAAASGFPVGIGGAGCTCGAVSGAVIALGMCFGRTKAKDSKVEKAMALARELHETFKSKHGSVCCRVLTRNLAMGSPEHMRQCIAFTGEVAGLTARIIAREKGFEIAD